MSRLLEGKVALVTGAGHGIGRGHALELAKHGATVVVNDLGGSVDGEGSSRAADHVVGIIESRGGTASSDYGDIGDEHQVEAMIASAWERHGRLDILINNAGIVRDRAIWNMSVEDFDLVMRVHARGTWLASRAVAQRWRAEAKSGTGTTYGRIINTVSGSGLLGNFGQTNYAAAKSAVAGLTLTLSLELASIGVTVNAISPGGLTRISAGINAGAPVEPDERPEDEFDPMDPSLCAPVVAWLASPEAGYVSGQIVRAMGETISLLGGWTQDAVVSNGGKRWNAATLGRIFETEVFHTRAPGLQFGS
ncbi:MAG: putative short-chain dehydrogenase/reductase [Subtercola sp.]|nr:putative short-chain dehydrogenase/reductase [Subtercola sp.]